MPRRSRKNAGFPLLDHIEKQMGKLRENLAEALNTFDEDSIHDARVATRRMKAAMELLSPVLSKKHRKPLDKGMRRIRRRLGPLRDADVMIGHLDKLSSDRRHGKAAAWLKSRLTDRRDALREESRDGPPVEKELRRIESWPDVRAEVADARDAVDSLLAESLHTQTDAFAGQADRLVADQAMRRAGEEPGRHGKPQNPHDLRITGKALRYTLEMAAAEGYSPGARVLTSFKQMQELLGTWHDFVVLADTALQELVHSELIHYRPTECDPIMELARHAAKRSTQELSAFCRLWENKGHAIAAKIRSLFDLTAPADLPVESSEPDAKAVDPLVDLAPQAAAKEVESEPDSRDEVHAVSESQTDRDPVSREEEPASADAH